MDNQAKAKPNEWARELCVEAFRDCGVKLREDDSLILVAAIFRRTLEVWLAENEQQLEVHAVALEGVAEEFGRYVKRTLEAEGERFREGLRQDVETANWGASQAVNRALSIAGKDTPWKHRMQGVGIGVVLVLAGVVLARLMAL